MTLRPTQTETEHLQLQVACLREYVLAGSDETVNQVLVALQPSGLADLAPTQSNIVLVLDDSGSMSGQPIEHVLAATRAIIENLGPHDQLGIVGFSDDAELVHPLVGHQRRDSLLRVTDPYAWSHGRRGHGTNMAVGLRRAWDELRRAADPYRVSRVIVLTDGFASNPEQTLEAARTIAADRVSIVALGFGTEFDMQFMDQVAETSGGACEYLEPHNVNAAIAGFLDQLAAIRDQLTDNTRISLTFRGQHRITDFWQTHPKVIYHGLARLGPDRVFEHRLADVERKRGLEMLFTVIHPPDSPGRKLVAEVEVSYDVPAVGHYGRKLAGRVIVDYGDDERQFLEVDSRIQRRYNDAFVEKQQLRARQLIESGQKDEAIRVLGTIRKRGNAHVRDLAEGTIRKVRDEGTVDRDQLFKLKMGTQKKRKDVEED